jgi:hypothetical protein
MNLFITLLENVNKSRTSANNVSLRLTLIQKSLANTALLPQCLKHYVLFSKAAQISRVVVYGLSRVFEFVKGLSTGAGWRRKQSLNGNFPPSQLARP